MLVRKDSSEDARRELLVLVVDDESRIRELIGQALDGEGYGVATAANGAEALLVMEHARPDLIILDLMMPVMDGAAFRAKQLAISGMSDVPVLILSAAHDARAQCDRLGAQGCIPKPFELDGLLDAVSGLVAGRSPRDL